MNESVRLAWLLNRLAEPLPLVRRHGHLVWRMTQRAIVTRYRGSALGLVWALLTPLALILVYTFVFHRIFGQRWPGGAVGGSEFAIVLFAGLAMFWLFSDMVGGSADLVVGRPNLVKRVVFPTEILPLVHLGAGLFHWLISVLVLLAAMLVAGMTIPWTVLWLPVLMLPFCLCLLGIGWILAAVGVYVRDLSHGLGLVTTVLLFLSPVFYPLQAVPEEFRGLVAMNPMAGLIESTRDVVLWGKAPDPLQLALATVAGWLVARFGLWVFGRLKQGFADVL